MSDLFDQVKELFRQTEEPREGLEPDSLYVINRFLSMVPEGFLVATRANRLIGKLPDWTIYKLMWVSLKQQTKAPFFNYIKRPTYDETDDEVLKKLMVTYAVGQETAEQFLKIFRHRDVDVEAAFGLERKKSKKEKKNAADGNNRIPGRQKKPRGRHNRPVSTKERGGTNERRSPFSGRSPFKAS